MPRARVFRRSRSLPGGKTRTDRWYSIDFDGPDGKRVLRLATPRTSSRRVADEILQREMARAWGPGGGVRPGSGRTVGDLLDDYETYLEKASPSTWRNNRCWIRWWKDRFGPRLATDLRPGDVETALLDLAETRQEATVAGYRGILRAALRRAVRDGHIASDPSSNLSVSYGYPERHVTWSEDELLRVRAAAPAWCSQLLEVLRATGLRIGDALLLRWDEVDLEKARLTLHEGQEKTGGELDVPLTLRAVAALRAVPALPGNPLVFPGQRGGPRAYNRVLRVVQAAQAACRPPVVGPTIHDLRRTWAVELLEAGTSLELIAALLGQKSTRVVPRYAKARFEALQRVLERLEPSPAN